MNIVVTPAELADLLADPVLTMEEALALDEQKLIDLGAYDDTPPTADPVGFDAVVQHPEKPVYYARDGMVWKSPVTRKTDTGISVTLGFPVCTMDYAVGPEAAETVAAMLNLASGAPNAPDDPHAVTRAFAERRGVLILPTAVILKPTE